MALETAKAMASGQALMIQAGTGVGKTLAYMVPGAIWRLKYNAGPILISTYTTNLQQQIFEKDYPFVRDVLKLPVHLVQALGRTRYLCLKRFHQFRKSIGLTTACRELLECINDCVETEQYSLFYDDLQNDEPLRGLATDFRRLTKQRCPWDDTIWQNICAESFSCTKRSCPYFRRCYFYRERTALAGADICVANHALVCAVLRLDSLERLLPNLSCCIIDEAHHFEDVAIEQLSSSFDMILSGKFFASFAQAPKDMKELEEHHDSSGWFADVFEASEKLMAILPREDLKRWQAPLDSFFWGDFLQLRTSVLPYFKKLEDYYENKAYENLECYEQNSSTAMLNKQWLQEGGQWGEELSQAGKDVETAENSCWARLYELKGTWEMIAANAHLDKDEDPVGTLLDNACDQLSNFMTSFSVCHDISDAANTGNWMEPYRGSVRLRAAVIDVGDYLATSFWSQLPASIATSATLKVDDNFDFFSSRVGISKLNADRVTSKSIASPFHYQTQALLAIASDLNRGGSSQEASDNYLSSACKFIEEASLRWSGRTLVLATSRYEVEKLYEISATSLEAKGITMLKQSASLRSEQLNRLRLARDHREKIVLIGTDSFWEGVDIAGEALSCVIILRLPFTSPDNPFFKIRSKQLGDQWFTKYSIPMAVLKFLQGFGRLIRTENDRGVVFVLDNRLDPIMGKGYRSHFLRALPGCQVISAPALQLLERAWNWFKQGSYYPSK